MSFIAATHPSPSKGSGPVDPADYPATYIDILYDHAAYLRCNQGRVGPGSLKGTRVAIIGAGAAGLVAAEQLLALGADITIYEASDRAGGRLHTIYPVPGSPAAFEMGAMRVPPCEQIYGFYCTKFGIKPGGQFPDPGKVATRIIYRNKAYEWAAGGSAPAVFNNVVTGWTALAGNWTALYKLLVRPTAATLASAQTQWQAMVYPTGNLGPEQGLSGISFYTGLAECFVEHYADYGLTAPWTGDDFELFGALGVGSGGFGPLYSVNFAEIARLVINGLETDQQFYPGGMQKLVDGFLDCAPDAARPDLRIRDCIRYDTRVIAIEYSLDPVRRVLVLAERDSSEFDQVIVATTNRSIQVDMNLTDGGPGVIPEAVDSALRELHLMNSSKLFVLTRSKFWQAPGVSLPSNIQSDTLTRGLYCLDYTPETPHEGYGVVLISYTWGDDSTKYLALADPAERLDACLRALEACAGDFVAALRPEILPEHTRMIDWQLERNYFGAFKLNLPGQDGYNQRLYSHFLGARDLFFAGDSIGWCGGWIESALQAGMNAACAVVNQNLGPEGLYANSPMSQTPAPYTYGPLLAVRSTRQS